MKNLIKILACIIVSLCFCNCGSGGLNESSCVTDTMPAMIEKLVTTDGFQIKVPLDFDPQTPLTDDLRRANLEDMVIAKYHSFVIPENRRKHKKVLHLRVNDSGVVDLTTGGPLSYEELWELKEKNGHSLREYFYDAAYQDKYTEILSSVNDKGSEYKYVPITSNLAKVYFIDDFEGFVNLNREYLDDIMDKLEVQARKANSERINNNQAKYE